MRSHRPIIDAFQLGRPVILAACIAVLSTSGCSRPRGEVSEPIDDQATQFRPADSHERVSDEPPQDVDAVADSPDATSPSQLPNVPDSELEPAPTGSQRETRLQGFIARHGRENVVLIRVSHAEALRPGELVRQLKDDLGLKHYLATRPAADAFMAFTYSGAIEDVVQFIDWGKVTSTDPQQRLILVDASGN